MSPGPVPTDLLPWALSQLDVSPAGRGHALTLAAGDASSRRYFRLQLAATSFIVVEAPPATEKNQAFLSVRALLAGAGIRVPGLYAADLERGYLLLEDLGDRLLLAELSPATVEAHYQAACDHLHRLAALRGDGLALPAYDEALLGEELARFPRWFADSLLGYSPGPAEDDLFAALSRKLVDSALEQPRVLVHRDFHSRNLMPQADGQLAVIDFQDAVVGPITYDLVSLLRDCYIRWPAGQVTAWALAHRDALQAQGLLDTVDDATFLRWFDWMGLQRHIKVLGTFARLYLRDDKPGYLEDLPLVVSYAGEVLDKYAGEEPVFAQFRQWFATQLEPLIATRPWSSLA